MIVYKSKRFSKNTNPERYYISKEQFLEEMIKYKETGKISNELGAMFLLLSKKLASAGNFRSYPFIDECIQEGVLTCLKYLHNFNTDDLAKNPFGYFSKCIINTFLVRIKKEKGLLELKKKLSRYDENGYLIEENLNCHLTEDSDYD